MRGVRQTRLVLVALAAGLVASVVAQQSPFNAHDDHTEYNLLDPGTSQFRIVYHLGQRRAGATTVLNQTRSGSQATNISVRDPQTGQPLKFEYRTGAELAAAGEPGRLSPQDLYIRAFLPRPVPENGEGRIRIEKTYLDEKSYFTQGPELVFARSLGIGRNAIVLPPGYLVVSSNVAGQLLVTPDGRVKIAFENVNTYASDVRIVARRTGTAVISSLRVAERAFDFGKTLYDLGDPETRTVSVLHEYVETTPGTRAELRVLARHRIADPVVTDLDTGRPLEVIRQGTAAFVELPVPIVNDTQSAHLRVTGIEQDSAYRVENGQLIWERTLYQPRTTILLPAGWDVTTLSAPATISTMRDARGVDRVAIVVVNPRLDQVNVALRATKRPQDLAPRR